MQSCVGDCVRRALPRAPQAFLGLLAVLTAAPALADDSSRVATLQEVVVTAERRSTNLQTTPVAATVLTGDDITRQNINTIDQLAFSTPSLTVQSSGENALINIRGIGRSDGGAQVSSGVLIYRDGVSTTPNGLISDEPYYDIGSIQVLRGPQGTFAGQNATGGAIFITEADPVLNRVGGYIEGQYGTYDDARLRATVNVPLSDTLAMRFATDDENRDTFFNMTGPWTGNPGKLHSANGRISTLWQPTEAFQAVLKVDYNYIDHGGSPAGPLPATGSTAHVFDVASDSYLSGYEHQLRGVLRLNYNFANGIVLRSISGYQDGRLSYSLDADGTATPPPLGISPEVFVARAKDRTVSQEINLISPTTGRFTWLVGAIYQDDFLDTPQFILSLAPGGTNTTSLALSAVKDQAERKSSGIFAQGGYQITDALKLQAGARYSQTSFTLNDLANALFFGIPIETLAINGEQQKDSKVTGKVDLDYTLSRRNFLYAFVATGHKGGGINGDGTIFQPEDVTDYEVGWKSKFLDGHVQTQLDGFYDNYRRFQLPVFVLSLGTGDDVNAAGTTVLKGIEAQMQAALGGLSLDLGASYVHSAIGQFSAIDSRYVAAGVQDLTGRPLPNAPFWTAQAGIQYAFDLGGDQTLTPRIDYSYVGARWATAFQVEPYDHLQAQDIVNADLTYDRPDNWQITAYVTNALNRNYVTLQLLGNLAMPAPPLQAGVRVSKSF
jgi:iron complex outermembrane receptor protein